MSYEPKLTILPMVKLRIETLRLSMDDAICHFVRCVDDMEVQFKEEIAAQVKVICEQEAKGWRVSCKDLEAQLKRKTLQLEKLRKRSGKR